MWELNIHVVVLAGFTWFVLQLGLLLGLWSILPLSHAKFSISVWFSVPPARRAITLIHVPVLASLPNPMLQ